MSRKLSKKETQRLVRRLLKSYGLGRVQRAAGVSGQAVYNWAHGVCRPLPHRLNRLRRLERRAA